MGLLPALPRPAPRCSSLSPETAASAQSLHTHSTSLATDLSHFNKHPSQASILWLFLAHSLMWSGTNSPCPQSRGRAWGGRVWGWPGGWAGQSYRRGGLARQPHRRDELCPEGGWARKGVAARQLQEPGRSPERTGRPPSLKGTAPAQTMASDNCKKVSSGTCGLCFYLFLNGTFLQHQLCRGWGALGLIISLHFYRNSPVLSAPIYR